MSASGKLQRGMRWPVKVRKGPFTSFDTMGGKRAFAADSTDDRCAGLFCRWAYDSQMALPADCFEKLRISDIAIFWQKPIIP
jgi:hypothetical protein